MGCYSSSSSSIICSSSSSSSDATLDKYKNAFEYEKRAYDIYYHLFGDKHDLTINCSNNLRQFMKLAVDQGSKQLLAEQQQSSKKKQDENTTVTTTSSPTKNNNSKSDII